MAKEIEIPEGYEARIEGNKVVIEQKESEDERIRKAMVDYFSQYKDDGLRGVDITPWIAYLEKQKEQKYYTYEQSKQAAEDCYYDKGYNTEDGGRCNQQSFLWGFEEGVNWCEQHKEQKPAERSEKEERLMKALQISNARIAELVEENYNLKETRQEWSEEDSKYASYVCAAIDCYYTLREERNNHNGQEELDAAKNWIKNRLKVLRPQPQTVYKTAIESILEICNSSHLKWRQFGAAAMDFWASVKVKCEEALQACPSLNESHWKPSEEQMDALRNASENTFSARGDNALESLYNDLKKL